MIQIYLVYILLIIWPFQELKIGQKQKGRLWVLWDSNPWSNFCDLHWQLICCKKWHPGTSEISTSLEIAARSHFYAQHGTKTTPVFLPDGGKASRSLLPSSISLCIRWHNATRKHLFRYSQGDRSGLRKPKKDKHQQ